jgi:hypothetical protein
MPGLVVCDKGLQDTLLVLRNGIYLRYFVRLFQNDRNPDRSDVAAMYNEATFSGYPGAVQITAWSAPALLTHVSTITGAVVNYAQDGGPFGNFIFGYYVTDGAGLLICAERRTGPGLPMFSLGDVYAVRPRVSFTSDLP